jgi:hypothetical protein
MARLIDQEYDSTGNLIAVTIEDDGYICGFEMVRHGRWRRYLSDPLCSECGEFAETVTNYCPNCGAKMDLEEKQ